MTTPEEIRAEFTMSVENAEGSAKSLDTAYQLASTTRLHEFLASVALVHERGARLPADEFEAFLDSRGASRTEKTRNEYHRTVTALIQQGDRKRLRARMSQYGQCLVAAASRNVNSAGLTGWLDTAEDVGRKKKLKGLSKALAIYRTLPEVLARNSARRKEAEDLARAKVSTIVENLAATPLGEIVVPVAASPNDVLLVLATVDAGGKLILLRAMDDQEAVRSIATKYFG